jgi:hypothetical protein
MEHPTTPEHTPPHGTPALRPAEPAPPAGSAPSTAAGRWLWQGKLPNAFWRAAVLFSFMVNLVLVLVVAVLALMVFQIKDGVVQPLVGGLHTSFNQMDAAHIVTTILVSDTIQVNDTIQVHDTLPVVFDLPLATNTQVTLTQDTPIHNTTVYLNGLPVPTDIVLPAGTPLHIALNLTVPVSQTVPVVLDVPVQLTVPVRLTVPVDIPLDQTQLHTPFTNLANLVGPYNELLSEAPSSWRDLLLRR